MGMGDMDRHLAWKAFCARKLVPRSLHWLELALLDDIGVGVSTCDKPGKDVLVKPHRQHVPE